MKKWIIIGLVLVAAACFAAAFFGYILPYRQERDAAAAQNENLAESYRKSLAAAPGSTAVPTPQPVPEASPAMPVSSPDPDAPPAAASADGGAAEPAGPAPDAPSVNPAPTDPEAPLGGDPAPRPTDTPADTPDPAPDAPEAPADELPLADRSWEWQPERPSQKELDERMLPQHRELYARNPAYAGWLTAAGAQVDLPVVQTPEENGYYLYRDFDGRDNRNGTLILDGACDLFGPSQNLIIYGHNMRSGMMFGELDRYTAPSACRENPLIVFDTLTCTRTYAIVAVLRSTQIEGGGYGSFRYAVDFADAEETADWIGAFERKRLFTTGVDYGPEDRFLTLSTCSYHEDNGRLIVIARELREGETAADFRAPE